MTDSSTHTGPARARRRRCACSDTGTSPPIAACATPWGRSRLPLTGERCGTGDPARGHRLARRIKAGTIGINVPYSAFPGVPFGGYKQSGFGRELGIDALDLYLETKSVLASTGARPFNPFGL